ncbi:MAG: pseudouridine-5'-phosphate glycosidase, partial [Candidatus Caldatribacteriota bacterium]|nr:pseudouridine-5'-phosphate glycosidase [Candidatus Caldatribacteriota bacterium]
LAAKRGIKGKELTPFILEQISHLTHKKSLKAIIELVINNAKLAGKIAKLSSLRYNLNSRDNTDDG